MKGRDHRKKIPVTRSKRGRMKRLPFHDRKENAEGTAFCEKENDTAFCKRRKRTGRGLPFHELKTNLNLRG
ncbi:MAG: hypothetical protein ACLVJ6_14225 [Merdibacter sp.]